MTRDARRPGGDKPARRKPAQTRLPLHNEADVAQLAFDQALIATGVANPQGRWIAVNAALCTLLGYAREQLLGTNTVDLIHPSDVDTHLDRRQRLRDGDLSPMDVRMRVRRKDGGELVARVHVGPVPEADGRLRCSVIQVQDVSEQVLLDAMKARHAADLRGLLDALPDAVGMTQSARWCFANARFAALLGHADADGIVGQPALALVHPDDVAAVTLESETMRQTGRASAAAMRRLARKDGSYVTVETVWMPVEFEGLPAVVWIARDVTERMQSQTQMMVTDRLASLGTLAAGAAHEINNPLAYMIANLDYLLDDARARIRDNAQGSVVEVSREAIRGLEDVRTGAERVRKIVRDLRSFSRVDLEQRGAVDVRHVLDTTVTLTAGELRTRAEIVREYGIVPLVVANEARLGQVFLNLVMNAAQAMSEDRRAENVLRLVTRTEGDRAVVEIHDTGEGIPEGMLSRIFDPFFTSRPVGVGTGLGLSVCHGIVTALGGRITARSAPGKGTTFLVSLPGARDASQRLRSITPPTTRIPRGKILVIDDEPVLGRSIQRMLSSEHDVTVLTSAADALDHVLRGERWDVILCDLLMPRMTGMDLHGALLALAPELPGRMVFLTGGAFTPKAREFLNRMTNPCLDKPFDNRVLRDLIREVLLANGPNGPIVPR